MVRSAVVHIVEVGKSKGMSHFMACRTNAADLGVALLFPSEHFGCAGILLSIDTVAENGLLCGPLVCPDVVFAVSGVAFVVSGIYKEYIVDIPVVVPIVFREIGKFVSLAECLCHHFTDADVAVVVGVRAIVCQIVGHGYRSHDVHREFELSLRLRIEVVVYASTCVFEIESLFVELPLKEFAGMVASHLEVRKLYKNHQSGLLSFPVVHSSGLCHAFPCGCWCHLGIMACPCFCREAVECAPEVGCTFCLQCFGVWTLGGIMCKNLRWYKAAVAHFCIAESSLCIACEGYAVKCLMEMEKFVTA